MPPKIDYLIPIERRYIEKISERVPFREKYEKAYGKFDLFYMEFNDIPIMVVFKMENDSVIRSKAFKIMHFFDFAEKCYQTYG